MLAPMFIPPAPGYVFPAKLPLNLNSGAA